MPPPGPFLRLLLLAWFPISLWGCLQCDEKFKENVAKLRTEVVPDKIQDSRLKERAEVLLKGLEGNFFLHYATSQFSGLAVKNKVDAVIHEARFRTESLLQTHLTDQALLDELVEFRRKTTMKLKEALKEHQMKACDKAACAWLNYKVLNCKSCQETSAFCLSLSQCFGPNAVKRREPRLGYRFRFQENSLEGCSNVIPCPVEGSTYQPKTLKLGSLHTVDAQERLSLRFGKPIKDPDIARTGVAIVLCMGGLLFVVLIGVIIRYWQNQLLLYV